MAALSASERTAASKEFMENLSLRHEDCAVTKADLQAAIVAMDQWLDDNKASANSALPTAARNNLTAAQKAEILIYVVGRRWAEGA